jgi:hypothetical protein
MSVEDSVLPAAISLSSGYSDCILIGEFAISISSGNSIKTNITRAPFSLLIIKDLFDHVRIQLWYLRVWNTGQVEISPATSISGTVISQSILECCFPDKARINFLEP